ncbi:MAG: iron-sulfur cluster assembly scaffold protein [Candidatus Pacebacteria bacterium]|nr:iron-sulfur cluster assembly scaffold protein [Candidatus Paceibacterota bacterium]
MPLNYTKKTLNHFLKPRNIGEIKNADAYAEIGNMVCGDQLNFSLKVEKGVIKDIKFMSFGCASNIATASIMTEKVKGMTLEEARNFDFNTITSELGGLPQQKIHCSVMAVQGLKKVIDNYEKKGEKVTNKKKVNRK